MNYFLKSVFECVCRLHIYVLDSHLATLWESNSVWLPASDVSIRI